MENTKILKIFLTVRPRNIFWIIKRDQITLTTIKTRGLNLDKVKRPRSLLVRRSIFAVCAFLKNQECSSVFLYLKGRIYYIRLLFKRLRSLKIQINNAVFEQIIPHNGCRNRKVPRK